MSPRAKRFSGASVAAAVFAAYLAVMMGWTPLCAGLPKEDPLYWLLGCFIDPPPPEGNG